MPFITRLRVRDRGEQRDVVSALDATSPLPSAAAAAAPGAAAHSPRAPPKSGRKSSNKKKSKTSRKKKKKKTQKPSKASLKRRQSKMSPHRILPAIVPTTAGDGGSDSAAAITAEAAAAGKQLYAASYSGSVAAVKSLIAAGVDVNQLSGGRGGTPLLAACGHGRLRCVRILLEAGAEVDKALPGSGATPLYRACQRGHEEVVWTLISAGAALDRGTTLDGHTPMITACFNGHVSVVTALIAAGASVSMATKAERNTPLHIACEKGDLAIVEALLASGASSTCTTAGHRTPLLAAAVHGHDAIIRVLAGHDGVVRPSEEDAAAALCVAAKAGNSAAVRALVASGAEAAAVSPNCLLRGGGKGELPWTALGSAAAAGHTEVVAALLSGGAVPDMTVVHRVASSDGGGGGGMQQQQQQHGTGRTPLYNAASAGHVEICRLLLQAGAKADRDTNCAVYKTALAVAVRNKCAEVVLVLVQEGGADPNRHGKTSEHVRGLGTVPGATMLFQAACRNELEIVKALASAGADVNLTTHDGATPLFVAAARGFTDVCRVLLAHGAVVDKAPNKRRAWGSKRPPLRTPPAIVCPVAATAVPRDTPLRLACEKGNLAVVRLLLQADADVHAGGADTYGASTGKTKEARGKGKAPVGSVNVRPLIYDAVHSYSTIIVSALMQKMGAGELLRVVGKDGAALLLGPACRHGHECVIKHVLDSGVSPDGLDKSVGKALVSRTIMGGGGHAGHAAGGNGNGNGNGAGGSSVGGPLRRSATTAGGFAATFDAATAAIDSSNHERRAAQEMAVAAAHAAGGAVGGGGTRTGAAAAVGGGHAAEEMVVSHVSSITSRRTINGGGHGGNGGGLRGRRGRGRGDGGGGSIRNTVGTVNSDSGGSTRRNRRLSRRRATITSQGSASSIIIASGGRGGEGPGPAAVVVREELSVISVAGRDGGDQASAHVGEFPGMDGAGAALPSDPTMLGEWRDEVMRDPRVVSAQRTRRRASRAAGAAGREPAPPVAPTTRAGAAAAAGLRSRAGLAPNPELFEVMSTSSAGDESRSQGTSWGTTSEDGRDGQWEELDEHAPSDIPSDMPNISDMDDDDDDDDDDDAADDDEEEDYDDGDDNDDGEEQLEWRSNLDLDVAAADGTGSQAGAGGRNSADFDGGGDRLSGNARWVGSDSEDDEDFWLPPEHDEDGVVDPNTGGGLDTGMGSNGGVRHAPVASWGVDLTTPPLQTAIEAGEHTLTEMLLKRGARKGSVACLISACERSCITSARLLLTAGVDPNGLAAPPAAVDSRNDADSRIRLAHAPVPITPLLAALSDRASWECSPAARQEVVELLLGAGASPTQAVLFPSTASRGLSHLFGVKRAKKLVRELAGANGQAKAANVYPLVCACTAAHVDVVEVLLAAGASLPRFNGDKQRRPAFHPVLEACRRKGRSAIDILELLRKHGCNIRSVLDNLGRTPLHIAADSGAPRLVRHLLKEHGVAIDPATDDLQLTPLATACRCDHLSPGVVKALIKAGADVNHQSLDQLLPPEAITPMVAVCNQARHDIVAGNGKNLRAAETVIHLLLKGGADIEKATVPSGRSPLYVACQAGFDAAVAMLLAAGSEVDRPHPQTGATPLMAALHAQPAVKHAVIERLLKAGAAVNAVTKAGVTPLIVASGRNAAGAVKALVAAGANLTQQTHAGDTALSVACQTGHLAIAKELINLGAGKAAVGGFERSPMYCACINGWDRFAQFLMDDSEQPDSKVAPFDPLATDRNGRSLLHFAAGNEMLEVVENLIHTSSVSAAASVTATDADGATPLHFASRLYALAAAAHETESPHRVLVVRLLLEAGADVNAVTTARPGPSDEPDLVPTGVTPLFVATMRGDMGVSAVLRAADAVSLPTDIPVTVAPRAGYIPVMVSFGDGLACISLAELGWLKHSHGLIWPSRLCAFTGHGADDAHGSGVTRQWIGELGRQLLTCSSRAQATKLGLPFLETLVESRGEARPPITKLLARPDPEVTLNANLPGERHIVLSTASDVVGSQDVRALLTGVGRALGLAICWRCSLGLSLAPSFCKLLVGKEDEIGVEDLEFALPQQQYRMLMACLDTTQPREVREAAVEAYTCAVSDDTMVTDSREYLRWEKEAATQAREKKKQQQQQAQVKAQTAAEKAAEKALKPARFMSRAESELVPGGNKVQLTVNNIGSFAAHLAKKLLVTNMSAQIALVRRGLEDVYGATTVLAHLPDGWFSLYQLLRGARKIDIDEWIKAADCDHTPESSTPVKLFWEGVRKLDDDQLRKLLHFWCAESPPPEGLANLGLKLVVDQRDGACLLQAATCFSLLKIPNTTSEEVMTKAILAGVAHWNLLARG